MTESKTNPIEVVNEGVEHLTCYSGEGSTLNTVLGCGVGFFWFLQGVANEAQSTQDKQNIDAV